MQECQQDEGEHDAEGEEGGEGTEEGDEEWDEERDVEGEEDDEKDVSIWKPERSQQYASPLSFCRVMENRQKRYTRRTLQSFHLINTYQNINNKLRTKLWEVFLLLENPWRRTQNKWACEDDCERDMQAASSAGIPFPALLAARGFAYHWRSHAHDPALACVLRSSLRFSARIFEQRRDCSPSNWQPAIKLTQYLIVTDEMKSTRCWTQNARRVRVNCLKGTLYALFH